MAKGDDETVRAVLADYRAASISERLRVTLAFLEKLTLRPAEVGPGDLAPLRAEGLNSEEIEDAIHVCVLFNLINRIADSLGFELQTEAGYAGSAQRLLSAVGYR